MPSVTEVWFTTHQLLLTTDDYRWLYTNPIDTLIKHQPMNFGATKPSRLGEIVDKPCVTHQLKTPYWDKLWPLNFQLILIIVAASIQYQAVFWRTNLVPKTDSIPTLWPSYCLRTSNVEKHLVPLWSLSLSMRQFLASDDTGGPLLITIKFNLRCETINQPAEITCIPQCTSRAYPRVHRSVTIVSLLIWSGYLLTVSAFA